MPRPRSLTLPQIAAAALAVLERDGLAALSMRTVAVELDVGTMSLYRYVDSKEQVEELVVGLVFGAVDAQPPARGSWSRRVTVLVQRLRAAAAAHPALVPLLVRRGHAGSALADWLEALLTLLAEAGFSPDDRVIAVRTLGAYVIGAVQLEQLAPVSGRVADFAHLLRDAYPLVAEAAAHGRPLTSDDEFERGLELVLRGIAGATSAPALPAASAPRGRRPPSTRRE